MRAIESGDDRVDFDLSAGKPKRWTPQRKAAVVWAIRRKLISVSDALERYDLSAAELAEWERNLDRFGVSGLQVRQTSRKTSKPK
jgi:hypothetical protein